MTPAAPAPPPAPYSLRQIQQMLGLSRKVIAGLIAAGFVVPQRGPRNAYRFSFQDVVLLRTAHQLRQARIPARRLLRSLKQLKARLPGEVPLSGLRIKVIGNEVAVRDAGAQWEAPSGQLVMDFEVTNPAGAPNHAGAASPVAPAASIAAPRFATEPAATDIDAPSSEASAALLALALQQEAAGDPAAAEQNYRRLLAAAPGHLEAAINLGALLCDAARWTDALAVCDGAIAAADGEDGREPNPSAPQPANSALLHFNRAIALEELQRPDQALRAYRRSLQLDPHLADAHYNAARLHEAQGHAREALRHLNAYRRLQKSSS